MKIWQARRPASVQANIDAKRAATLAKKAEDAKRVPRPARKVSNRAKLLMVFRQMRADGSLPPPDVFEGIGHA